MKGRGNGVVGRRKVSNLKLQGSKNGVKKQPLALRRFAEGEGDGSGHRCGECGKIFKTCKALYGHMRAHPERRRRHWGFKKCSGASGVGSSSSGPSFGDAAWFGANEMEAAKSMIMLADGPCSTSVSPRLGGGGTGLDACLVAAAESMEVDTSTDTTMEEGEEQQNAAQSRSPLASLDLNQLPDFTERGSSPGCCYPVKALVLDLSLGLSACSPSVDVNKKRLRT